MALTISADKRAIVGVPASKENSPNSSVVHTPVQGSRDFKGQANSSPRANPFAALLKRKNPTEKPGDEAQTMAEGETGKPRLVLKEGQIPYTQFLGVSSDGQIQLPVSLEPGSLLEAYYSVLKHVRDSQVVLPNSEKPRTPYDDYCRMREQILLTVKNFAEAIKLSDLKQMFEEESNNLDKSTKGSNWGNPGSNKAVDTEKGKFVLVQGAEIAEEPSRQALRGQMGGAFSLGMLLPEQPSTTGETNQLAQGKPEDNVREA